MSREGRKRWDFFWRKSSHLWIGKDNPAGPMMHRWRLLQTPLFGIYLHYIYREDLDRDHHDHPWAFTSILLRGGYEEEYVPDVRVTTVVKQRRFRRGWIHHFPLTAAHRITSVQPKTTSLCLVGPKARPWGFWLPDGIWIDDKSYELLQMGWPVAR